MRRSVFLRPVQDKSRRYCRSQLQLQLGSTVPRLPLFHRDAASRRGPHLRGSTARRFMSLRPSVDNNLKTAPPDEPRVRPEALTRSLESDSAGECAVVPKIPVQIIIPIGQDEGT